MLVKPESIFTVPYIKDINPYRGTLFEKYLLNKPAVYKNDEGEKIVVYHFVDFNSTEYFPVQVMLHPQGQLRGYYKIPYLKLHHFPKPDGSNYFELSIKNFDPLSDVDKVSKFKKDLVKKGFLTDDVFKKYVEDRINYVKNVREINTAIEFSLVNV